MAKKKLRDCTYGEVINFCKKQKDCDDCPLNVTTRIVSIPREVCDEAPLNLDEYAPAALDIEIDIPEEVPNEQG